MRRSRAGRRAPRGNLPSPISSFIGREEAIDEVGRLLGRHRLLTLTGAGGVGKSRLALEVAHGRAARFRDGAWLVELTALADGSLLPQTLASALGVRVQPGQALLDTLLRFLAQRELLLVLDNCEHLTAACATLATTLLRGCPGLRIVATSRQPLGAPAETVWRVPSLSVPASDSRASTDIAASEAVALFAVRAGAALRTFALTDAQAPSVAEICRRLDGIPLAIELAAALVPALTVQQIAGRLDDRFRLLAGGDRTGLPRHRTLRALVDWSYDLLTEDDKAALHHLAVFAGGWTLEAAEVVLTDASTAPSDDASAPAFAPERTAADVRAALARLVAASLVTVDRGRAEPRFRLLETIRAYGLERLAASGAEPQVRRRHLRWTVALVEEAEPHLWTAEQRAWTDRLDRELPNIRAALTWSLEGGEIESGLRIASRLWRYWEFRASGGEARNWLSTLLDRAAGNPGWPRVLAEVFVAYFAYWQGDLATAQTLSEEALRLARREDDAYTLVAALQVRSIMSTAVGEFDQSEAYLREGLALSQATELALGVRMSLANLGEMTRIRGHELAAEPLLEEALALSQVAGDAYLQVYISLSLAHMALNRRALGAARERLMGAIPRDPRDLYNLSLVLEGLGWVAAAEGHAERAARLLGVASGLRERQGAIVLPHWRADHERASETARDALGERAFDLAWRRGAALPPERAIAYALDSDAQPSVLTDREREIAGLIADGAANREIARALGISERTVEWHVSNILGKIDRPSRAGIAAWALDPGVRGCQSSSAIP